MRLYIVRLTVVKSGKPELLRRQAAKATISMITQYSVTGYYCEWLTFPLLNCLRDLIKLPK